MRSIDDWMALITSRLSRDESDDLWGKFRLHPADGFVPGEIVKFVLQCFLPQFGMLMPGTTARFVRHVNADTCTVELVDAIWQDGIGPKIEPGHSMSVTISRLGIA